MYVQKLLDQVGTRVFKDVVPSGAVVIKIISDASGGMPIAETATGEEVSKVYSLMTPEAQAAVAEDIGELILTTLPPVVTTPTPVTTGSQTRDYRAGIALMMAVTLTLQCFAYGAMVIYIAIMTRTIPDVSDTFVPFMVQALIVWNYNGLLTKENRDSLAAGLGAIPGGVIQSIVQMITSRRSKGTPPAA